ncbi:DUF4215 domain-containing protein, partial [candidate division KSB1 bacterium]
TCSSIVSIMQIDEHPSPPPPPPPTPICGDLVIGSGEQCDDGNRTPGDGCDADCQMESPDPPVCGNALLETGETCDDGNLVSEDSCSATCQIEFCSDGTLQEALNEECDDGNVSNGDDCDSQCRNEMCGNAYIQSGEECDDGNMISGDGCSSDCQLEDELPDPECGNAILEDGEECDDGNLVSGDGCSSICIIDTIDEQVRHQRCSIRIKQEERNECCQETFVDDPHPTCEGYWIFDYHTRLCVWWCPVPDCSVGTTQTERDMCCYEENEGQPKPPCIGNWVYDNFDQTCVYECVIFDGEEERTEEEIDATSSYCINTYEDENERSQCCDEFLKHPLSIGHKPGYPDCIGKWSIKPGTAQCLFECVSHEEMLEILKELKEQMVE